MIGILSRRLGQPSRVNHGLGDFLLARDDHVGAEAAQVFDPGVAVGACENPDAGVELARDLDDATRLETVGRGDMDQLRRFDRRSLQDVDRDGVAGNGWNASGVQPLDDVLPLPDHGVFEASLAQCAGNARADPSMTHDNGAGMSGVPWGMVRAGSLSRWIEVPGRE